MAENRAGSWGSLDPEALGADGDAAVGADFDGGKLAPNVRPARTVGGWAQDRAAFFEGEVPSLLGFHVQLAMDLLFVAVEAQEMDVGIGVVQLADAFTGEVGGQAGLPELMFAFDLALGLGGGGVPQRDPVETQGPAQLGEALGNGGEEEAVVVDVEFQRQALGAEGQRQEVEIGRFTGEPFTQQASHLARPGPRMVPSGSRRGPLGFPLPGTGPQVIGVEFVEAAAREPQTLRALCVFALTPPARKETQRLEDSKAPRGEERHPAVVGYLSSVLCSAMGENRARLTRCADSEMGKCFTDSGTTDPTRNTAIGGHRLQ